MGLGWTLRKMLHRGRARVSPAEWVMNLDVGRYTMAETPESLARREQLNTHYSLSDLIDPGWHWVGLESLYQLDQVDRMLASLPSAHRHFYLRRDDAANVFTWVDVGSKNFGYLPALIAAGQALTEKELHVTGIELDPYQRYIDGHTRGDYARGICDAFPHTQYRVEDVMNIAEGYHGKVQVVSCFLPFVTPEEHLAWGLGKRQYDPTAFFQALVDMLAPGGLLLISNLSEIEVEATRAWLRPYLRKGEDSRATPLPNPLPKGRGDKSVEDRSRLLLHCEAERYRPHFLSMQEPMRYLWTLQKPF